MPKEVQWAACKKYVKRCHELHDIAFLQWRLDYPSKLKYNEQELEILIMARINKFTSNLAKTDKASISQETKQYSEIASDFLTKNRYNLVDVRRANFLINRFWTVGLADPYPNDYKTITGSLNDIPKNLDSPCRVVDRVYPDSRYS